MADEDEDENLLDDSFDELPEDAFDQLENNAVQLTQAWNQSQPAASFEARTLPLQSRSLDPRGQFGAFENLGAPELEELGDEELDGEVIEDGGTAVPATKRLPPQSIGEATQREHWRLRRFGGPSGLHVNSRQVGGPPLADHGEVGDAEMHDYPDVEEIKTEQDFRSGPDGIMDSQMKDFVLEREKLKQSLDAANAAMMAKAGEISIIRANNSKALKESERRLIAMQRLHTDERSKMQATLEQVTAERKKAAEQIQFLEHDLRNQEGRVRDLQQRGDRPLIVDQRSGIVTSRVPEVEVGEVTVQTPRKQKSLPFRDGFDDVDISLASPRRRSGGKSTPRLGGKRKRKGVDDSPAKPLDLRLGHGEDETAHGYGREPAFQAHPLGRERDREADRLSFLRIMLGRRQGPEGQTFGDRMATFHLPSRSRTSFATIIMEQSASSLHKDTNKPEPFQAKFCQIIISLWLGCLGETCYAPLSSLIDILTMAISFDTLSTVPHIIDEIVAIAQQTGDINAIRRCSRDTNVKVIAEVDLTSCLRLLYLVGLGCQHDTADMRRFWQCMREDFVALIMHQNQLLEDVMIMINLLDLSVMSGSFGTINASDESVQKQRETFILTRLSELLQPAPNTSKTEKPYDRIEVAHMLLSVLGFLKSICETEHGGESVARHRTIIGRLVRLVHSEVDNLYDYRADRHLGIAQINLAVRLLYLVITQHASTVDLQARLAAIHGGSHMYLVSLARLTFSEGLVLDAGIDDEIVEQAHRLLEEWVTPEEGEALWASFTVPPTQPSIDNT